MNHRKKIPRGVGGLRVASGLPAPRTLTLNIDFAVLLSGVSGEGMVLSGRPD